MASTIAERLRRVANRQTVKITHYGRKSGRPHEVTIWFTTEGDKIYLSSDDVNKDWVKNVRQTPRIKLTIGNETFDGEARWLEKPAERDYVQGLVQRKYRPFLLMMSLGRHLGRRGSTENDALAFEVTLQN